MCNGFKCRRDFRFLKLPMMNPANSKQQTENRKCLSHSGPTAYCLLHTAYFRRGFTLVETMVAITVLTISIVGPFTIASSSYQAAAAARDQLTANYLAQEAIEYIRSIRDANYLAVYPNHSSSSAWLTGLSACMTGKPCTVDPTGNAIPTVCNDGTCASTPMNLSSTNLYNQGPVSASNVPTPFTRAVRVTNALSPDEADITVVVTWSTAHRTYTATVTDHLFNWL